MGQYCAEGKGVGGGSCREGLLWAPGNLFAQELTLPRVSAASRAAGGRRQWPRAPPGQRGPAGGAPLRGVLGRRYKGSAEAPAREGRRR